MATIFERANSRGGTLASDPLGQTTTLEYCVFGTTDEAEVNELVAETIPDEFTGMLHQSWSINPVGPDIWHVTVDYANKERRNIGDWVYTFEFGSTSQHITQSLETISRTGLYGNDDPPNAGRAIGVTADGVAGCDILVPQPSFRITTYLADSKITPAYQRTVMGLIGRTNDAAYMEYEPGELLLTGSSGARRSRVDWEVSFSFHVSLDRTLEFENLDDPEDPIYVDKPGWAYAWFTYQDVKVGNRITKRPSGVYIERVYDSGDFTKLKAFGS